MLCLVYKFAVKPDQHALFRAGWREVTEFIYRNCGSLGARLHRGDDGFWFAYAQWPDEHHWQLGETAIREFLERSQWDEICLSGPVEVLMQMEVTDDLLQPHVYRDSS